MPDESWDYTTIPEQEWTFPGLLDEVSVHTTQTGLYWRGEAWDGGYVIGFQSYEQFLEKGPLKEYMPPEVRETVRNYILLHRQSGPATRVIITARIGVPQQVPLHQISLGLDEQQLQIFTGGQLRDRTEVEIHRGSLAAGSHVLSGAVAWDPPQKGNIFYFKQEFTVPVGQTARIVLDVLSHMQVVCRIEEG